MAGIIVPFTPDNLEMAALHGVKRMVYDLGWRGKHGIDNYKEGWQRCIEGTIGEWAVAKYMKMYYDGNLGNLLAKDVGNLQVRATRHEKGKLSVYKSDSPDDMFVLVLLHRILEPQPKAVIWGWAWGKHCQQKKYWGKYPGTGRKGGECYMFPQLDPKMEAVATLKTTYQQLFYKGKEDHDREPDTEPQCSTGTDVQTELPCSQDADRASEGQAADPAEASGNRPGAKPATHLWQ